MNWTVGWTRHLPKLLLATFACHFATGPLARAQAPPQPQAPASPVATDSAATAPAKTTLNLRQLLDAGGYIGLVIVALSIAMVALVVEHLLSIRRGALMPAGLAEGVRPLIAAGKYTEGRQLCQARTSFLGQILTEGLAEVPLGYPTVEKAIEESSAEQAARLFRKIEYLSVIGTIAPMLGLLGTVWGMIIAFQEFANKVNPPVSELAPGIYQALVTTLLGLGVAVPALAAFAIFRNRVDELVAEAVLTAEQAFVDFKRSSLGPAESGSRRRSRSSGRVNPVTIEQSQEAV